jgi:hypothetical protein
MRLFQPFMAFIACTLVLLSCKKDKEKAAPPGANKITLWAGQDTVITMAGTSGQYTATSGNDEIARTEIQDHRLHITTDMPGSTTIRVTDQANQTTTIQLEAISVTGKWNRRIENMVPRTSIFVECGDPALAGALQDELKEEVITPQMTRWFIFVADPAEFEERKFGGDMSQGTFSFRNLRLTLTRNDTSEVYPIHPVGLRMIGLEQDLTAQYQTLHPTKGITRVAIIRYFNYAPMN